MYILHMQWCAQHWCACTCMLVEPLPISRVTIIWPIHSMSLCHGPYTCTVVHVHTIPSLIYSGRPKAIHCHCMAGSYCIYCIWSWDEHVKQTHLSIIFDRYRSASFLILPLKWLNLNTSSCATDTSSLLRASSTGCNKYQPHCCIVHRLHVTSI